MTTCPDAAKDDKLTQCEQMIAATSEPGKCYAVCSVGFSKVGYDSMQSGCTDDEKKQLDEADEKNQAAYEAALSSGSALAPTFTVATTAAVVVFAALY